MNDYTMQLYVDARLQDARDAAARRALAPPPPLVRPALKALLIRLQTVYGRIVRPRRALAAAR